MEKIVNQLNDKQREAVFHTEGPLIIFAGAGTGKTRVITYRIAYLLSKGISPLNILAVTFTNKAAEEMRRRVDKLYPGRGRSVWISTFHSFGAQILRAEAKHIGLDSNFLIYDDLDQKNVLKECIKGLNLDENKFKPGRIQEIISRSKDELLDADSYGIHSLAQGDYFRQIAATVYGLYQKKLKQAGALDFGDLLMLTVALFRDKNDVLEKYRQRFKYIMVDEYQDTNHAQYILTKSLAGAHKNICVVGDDDQSIYSWRGADIRNILEFERDYPGCQMIKLEQNYRSSSKILSCAWQVVRNNINRVDKKVWTENNSGSPVKFVETENELEESHWIVREIQRLYDDNRKRYSDFAVFYRINAQSRVLEDAFRREGIPYNIVGTVRFYERAEVKDIIAYLRLIFNPNDSVSFKRIVNVPRRGIGKTTIETISHYAVEQDISMWDALKFLSSMNISTGSIKSLSNFKKVINELRANKDLFTVKEIAISVLEKTGYIAQLEKEDTPEAKNRLENVHELISAIDEFERRSPDKSLGGYLTQISLISDIDSLPEEEQNDRVTLMTLHLAKGLEFKTVFVSGLEEGLFPIGESSFDANELEEERRLMYVGMTRAKQDLYLTWATERRVFGRSRWNMPSRFIEEAKAYTKGVKSTIPEIKEEQVSFAKDVQDELFPLDSRVKHPQFGEGKVIDKSGSDDDLKLVVLFDSGQWKKLLVKYANLEIVG